ncbi:stealth conserved region 3 domain-containing protein [Paeniglutamicibacter sp. Y32M11]|uniref:stealth conserved region 3 domain-containing protein n=1 Tax=Paeniglutamicibacter sp. Y32M11 TaxID=2853258 RepID=UPI001C52B881|nr:stealth conserved region 3 domain-containing protein [Paeniglutamicibacter sp. Y32M11]QXQ08971.1 stealth conserved region 3 domain-containing protein [Paeniglutamicibacter sp. Y32M11]
MAEHGHEVTVASVYQAPDSGFDFGDGVRTDYITQLSAREGQASLVIPREWDDQFCSATDSALFQYFSACTADIIVTSTPALTVFALLACPASVKVVQQEHRNSMARGSTAEPILRHSPRVDSIVALTERNKEWLQNQWGSRAPRVDVIPNALPNIGRPRSSGTQKVVMGAGRLVSAKGFSTLVRAFSRVADEFPDWRLRIFGDGPGREQVIATARNLGIARQVEIFPPTDEIEQEWARASIGALASVSEGLPLVLLEARGAGLPLVSFDCETGPREIIEHGKDGYLVPVGDVGGFAEALRILMGDEGKRLQMAARATESLQRFAPDVIATQWETLFQELVKRPLSARQLLDIGNEGAENGGLKTSGVSEKAISGSSPSSRLLRSKASSVDSNELNEASKNGNSGDSSVIAVTLSEILPERARENNRQRLEEMFEGSHLRCRALKSTRGMSWGVRMADRNAVLEHLVQTNPSDLEVRLYAGRTRLDMDGVSWRTDRDEVAWADVSRLFIFHHFGVNGTRRHVGFAAGITLEFWDLDERRPDLYRAPRVNFEVDHLSSDQFNQPLFALWVPSLSRPLWSSVEFPVDVVYTWVDGSDKVWRQKRDANSGETVPSTLAGGELRFRNRDELRYSLRSLYAHAPWIRHIYLVTDGQRPAWLKDHERITVVDHRELFPNSEVLPVFNSHAIETVLHRIPGLSEHFLYMNDDVFLMKDQQPEKYFTSVGQARFFLSSTKINDLGFRAEPHEAAGMNNRRLVERDFGVTITQGMLHTPHPQRVSMLEKLCEQYSEEISTTRAQRFRSGSDISLISSLAQYAGYMEGAYIQGELNVSFIPLGAPDTLRRLSQMKFTNLDCLTFGEAESDPNPDYTQEIATTFMKSTFQIPAPWEI